MKVELRFTDEDWDSEGFHGVVAVKVPAGGKSVDVPSFEGETDKLPAGIESIRSHGCFQCGSGSIPGAMLRRPGSYIYGLRLRHERKRRDARQGRAVARQLLKRARSRPEHSRSSAAVASAARSRAGRRGA